MADSKSTINSSEENIGGGTAAKAGEIAIGEFDEQREGGSSRSKGVYIEKDARGRERLVIPRHHVPPSGLKISSELIFEFEEREALLNEEISSLQTRLRYAQRDRDQYAKERLQEEHAKLRLAESLRAESDLYRTKYETMCDEVEALRDRLVDKDRQITERGEQIRLARTRIDDSNRTINHLQNYLRTQGLKVEDSSSEAEQKGNTTMDQQHTTPNDGLETRVAELEVINESFRVKQLEKDEQNSLELEVLRRESEGMQMAIRDIAGVIVAVLKGDLTQKVAIQPNIMNANVGALRRFINEMVDHLQAISFRVSGVARDIRQEGKIGSQAYVPDAEGAWREMIDNVNQMSIDFTNQVRAISHGLVVIGNGDFTQKVEVESNGEVLVLREIVNHLAGNLKFFADKITKIETRATIKGEAVRREVSSDELQGSWAAMIDSANSMANLAVGQSRAISEANDKLLRRDTTALNIDPEYTGQLLITVLSLNNMLKYLFENQTTAKPEDTEKEAQDRQLEQEKLRNIWAILQSNI